MLISVVVPVYKVEKYLHRCVDSILSQIFTDFELILVDDGSPDNCGDICEEYAKKDERVKVIHQKNGGLSSARNTGIDWAFENSDSQWITFIDSDDWIHPQYLEVLLKSANDLNLPVSICGYMKTEGEACDIAQDKFIPKVCNVADFFVNHNVNAIVAWGKLYKKECFKSIRYPVGKLHEDEFTTYKILFDFENVAVVEAEMYFYFFNSESIMNSSWSPRRLDVLEAFEERLAFLHDRELDSVYEFQMGLYFCILYENCKFLVENNSDERYNKYLCDIRKKMRLVIRKYNKILGISFKKNEDKCIYELAYPKLMYLYWIGISFINKFKRNSR